MPSATEWTPNTLFIHLSALIDAHAELNDAQREAINLALEKAEAITTAQFAVLTSTIEAHGKSIEILENKNSNLGGRMWSIGAAITVVNLGLAIAAFFASRP